MDVVIKPDNKIKKTKNIILVFNYQKACKTAESRNHEILFICIKAHEQTQSYPMDNNFFYGNYK